METDEHRRGRAGRARTRWLVAAGMLLATLLVLGMSFIPTEGNQVMEFLGTPKLSLPIGIGTASILGVIGLLAGYFPARRAASIDPAATLRYE